MQTSGDGFEARIAELLQAELLEIRMATTASDVSIGRRRRWGPARIGTALAVSGAAVIAGVLLSIQLAGRGLVGGKFELPSVQGDGGVCAGVGIEGTLRGDPTDRRVAWVERSGGGRTDIVWPHGYTAQFNPVLTVRDADGHVQFREGDSISGACRVSGDQLLVMP